MDYLIAVDGGGTKTEALLTDRWGHVLARRVGGPSNPNDSTVAAAADTVSSLVLALTAEVSDAASFALFAGIAGASAHAEALEEALRERLPEAISLRVNSDLAILLTAELPGGDGACIICGTGSACFLRCRGEIIRIGGWGYLLDSGGSGYDIGRDALEAVLRAYDGRGQGTVLSDLLEKKLGAPVQGSITALYQGGKPLIASCAPAVFTAAAQGDAVAEAILERNAYKLAEYIETAYQYAKSNGDMSSVPFRVIMGGGISQKASGWLERVHRLVADGMSVDLKVASMPPVLGAVLEAAHMVTAAESRMPPEDDAIRQAFAESYAQYL